MLGDFSARLDRIENHTEQFAQYFLKKQDEEDSKLADNMSQDIERASKMMDELEEKRDREIREVFDEFAKSTRIAPIDLTNTKRAIDDIMRNPDAPIDVKEKIAEVARQLGLDTEGKG